MIKKFIKEKPFHFFTTISGIGLLSVLGFQKLKEYQKNKWFNTIDKQSLSNLNQVTTLHHNFILDLDFKQKIIKGTVTYTFLSKTKKLKQVILDISKIKVNSVQHENQNLQFSIKKTMYSDDLGDQLIINLNKPITNNQEFQIVLEFQTVSDITSEDASALNWLEPSQTLSKEHPYLFTQCQPIFCRTIFPCQDSPSVKSTFEAKISVPRQLSAWCSGKLLKNTYNKGQNTSTFHFHQDIPIPSYLFSIVAGNLEQKSVSSRCSVITEPQFINACADELENMEQFIIELENYTGVPYEWGEYKIVILPPSFPYGGMENPVLTFANPTIIVGDKSCQDLVIHEMAHSWSGNLVSCKNWEHFWLNEGMTMFLENKVNGIINGKEHKLVVQTLQNDELKIDIDDYTGDLHKRYTPLIPILNHDNPDDAFSLVPYIKGCQFLTLLEKKVGEDNWQNFVQSYFKKFRNKSLDTQQFLEFFKQFLTKTFTFQQAEQIWDSIDFQSWLHQPGYPPQTPELQFKSNLIKQAEKIAEQFAENSQIFQNQVELKEQYQNFKMELKVIFMNKIYDLKQKLQKKDVEQLDLSLNLMKQEKNPEILFKFILLGINYDYKPVLDLLPEFLSSVGRMKFCRPIYKELHKTNKNQLAQEIYQKNINFYHSIAVKMIGKDLEIK